MFIAFLYMFRATISPSSGDNTVPMRYLVFVTLLWMTVRYAYRTCVLHKSVIHIELQILGDA